MARTTALGSAQDLYQLVSNADYDDVVVRRTLEGVSEVVYSEVDDPVVKLHASTLFTGP